MSEHVEQHEETPYWNTDVEIGAVRLWERDWTLRLQAHVQAENFYALGHELVPLRRRGERVYVHGKPYILEPDYRLTIAVDPAPQPGGPVGKVEDSAWVGMRRRNVGDAQAWYYPGEQTPSGEPTIVLWECFLNRHHTPSENDPTDPNLTTLWQGFERFLIERFPDAAQIVTTADDPFYETPDYQTFLRRLGYERISQKAFGKPTVR